jgi:hypothetical protein
LSNLGSIEPLAIVIFFLPLSLASPGTPIMCTVIHFDSIPQVS